jgi:hypothetical protein
MRIPLVAAADNGGIVSQANPYGRQVWIGRTALYITTGASSGTADIGVAANGSTSSDTLLDGVANNAAGVFNNIDDKGTNGKSRQLWGATQFVTATQVSGTVTGLVGFLYVEIRDP